MSEVSTPHCVCGTRLSHHGQKGWRCKKCGRVFRATKAFTQQYRENRAKTLEARKVTYDDLANAPETHENPHPVWPGPLVGGVCRWCRKPAYSKRATWCGTWVDWAVGRGRKVQNVDGIMRRPCWDEVYLWWFRTPPLRRAVFKQNNFTCQICRTQPKTVVAGVIVPNLRRLHVDHVQPIAKGGKTEWSNLQALCIECNLRKSDKL